MPKALKSRDQIRREGLLALREMLGRAGMIRFLKDIEKGTGDYVHERRQWVESTSLEELVEKSTLARQRRGQRRRS